METENKTNQLPSHKKVGPIVVTLVVVLVVVIVALYIFASKITNENLDVTGPISQAPATIQTQTIPTITRTTDDVQSLQNDLNMSTNGIDSQNF